MNSVTFIRVLFYEWPLLKSGQRRALLKFEQFVLKFDRGAPSLDPEDLYAVPTRPQDGSHRVMLNVMQALQSGEVTEGKLATISALLSTRHYKGETDYSILTCQWVPC